jgi:hypothetical protein
MNTKLEYLPIRTVVKFYDNHEPSNSNKLMTKTLLKAGFIDNEWLDGNPKSERPADGEFWLVDVVHETCAGQPKGCFLLHPIRKIDPSSLSRLLPGMYDEVERSGCLVLEPKTGGLNWILPLRHKKSILNIYAIIVSQ